MNKIKWDRKKKIELSLVIFLLVWLILFAINYMLYTKGNSPILMIPKTIKYEDGTVKEWIGLGYIYRKYNRTSLTKEEFVPFWVKREKRNSLFPETYKDYSVPKNDSKERRIKGILYFYNDKKGLLGTYKCINTSVSCDWAGIGIDNDNLINKDPLTKIDADSKFAIMYDKYAFIEDSVEQKTSYGDPFYSKTIYLFSILENKIIAKFEDVKPSIYGSSFVEGEEYNYIVKSDTTHKWGLIHLEKDGSIKEILPFEYTSINYDKDTDYYILHKEKDFSIYDKNTKKEIVKEIKEPVFDVWINENKSLYYKTGIENEKGNVIYSIYHENKEPFFINENATEIVAHAKFIFYVDEQEKQIKFMDYSLTVKDTVKLYFTDLTHEKNTHPAFIIDKVKKGVYYFQVYKSKEEKATYDYRSVDTNDLFGNTNTIY